ncbi:MAG TPA: alpha/beta hydrolase [Sorangium sp.]|nr:alpha/beta hydrolase [Sorangium sp.]
MSGSGPHQVVVETNSDPGINEGTIYRPADLDGDAKFPIFVWGEGGCSRDGFATQAAMAEIASHGYFVVADGTPVNSQPNRDLGGGGEVLLAYIDWVIAENEKPCSAYYHKIDTTKVGANGFSCGGLMAAGTAADPRMTTWGHTSSGSFSVNQAFYNSIHTPVLIVTGTEDSLGANENGARDFENIAAQGDIPVMMFAKVGADHGGDLWARNGGEFTQVNLAWLNWWLKGDESATGKGMLVGASCRFCTDRSWQVSSANLP